MHKPGGFTLLEVVVVMAIIAIMTALAAPGIIGLIQSNSVASNVNTFMADIRFARSEAVRRGGAVVMCRSDDPEAAAPTCGTGSGPGNNGWVSGWIIFEDRDGSQNYTSAGDQAQLLKVQGPIVNLDSIVEASSTKFQFTATGRMKNLTSATSLQFGSNMPNTRQRVVCVNGSGRVRIAGDGTASCSAATDQ
ncbi:MAG: GspH/FimT family pseudopilin [Polaromonas sp.]|uniref:GspH/FimT family pseudopilin n=1 Tax=Polaromonas sp. TaxID=1869339 RepID=UPI0025E59884|nr:GspH/FimT family pseudopilin [Polaromonas sp.]MBI2728980.1 GspH/FimT family pseudopilin [Polaromonas sp.]